eukprot:CAMPEP_0180341502 /NCGR_PEP_ID=MMETSP0989-20121125/1238_1 /TAXON_ID=697907 /ORGANISM="non described non described, Strain CCMP2293" /LENGTH=185 /DNA_ID=CAMNT_0022330299 /DNA_START=266 /DNA_END=822 /DNA_ORIENTATION=-
MRELQQKISVSYCWSPPQFFATLRAVVLVTANDPPETHRYNDTTLNSNPTRTVVVGLVAGVPGVCTTQPHRQKVDQVFAQLAVCAGGGSNPPQGTVGCGGEGCRGRRLLTHGHGVDVHDVGLAANVLIESVLVEARAGVHAVVAAELGHEKESEPARGPPISQCQAPESATSHAHTPGAVCKPVQ